MHLHEVMGWDGPMTERQFQAWNAWLDAQWNEPDRGDCYAMQIAALLAGRKDVRDMQIKFGTGGSESLTKEAATAYAKAKWFAALGIR